MRNVLAPTLALVLALGVSAPALAQAIQSQSSGPGQTPTSPLLPVNNPAVTNGNMGETHLLETPGITFPCSSWGGIFPGGKTYTFACFSQDWNTTTAPGGATVGPNTTLFASAIVDSAVVGNPTAVSADALVRVTNGVGLSENFIAATSGNVGLGPIVNAKLYNEDDFELTSGDSIASTSIMHNYINFNAAFPLGLNFASAGTAVSTGTLTFVANPTNTLNIVLNGVTWTFVTSGASGTQTNIQGTLALTLAQLATDLNASANGSLNVAVYDGTATGTTLIVSDKTPGVGGNAYTLAVGTAASARSAATLTGGGPASIINAIQFQGPYTDAVVGAGGSTYLNFINNAGSCTGGCLAFQGAGAGNGLIIGGTGANSVEWYGDGAGDALFQLGSTNFFQIAASGGGNNFSYLATLASGGLTINNTTQATTAATGAIITAGGLGVAKAAFITGNLNTAASVLFPGLASSSAGTTGTLCWTTGTGNVNVDTTTTCLLSDMRLKEHIKPLDAGLAEVMALKPISYDVKVSADPVLHALGEQVGLGAQDVQKVDPRLVAFYDNGPHKGTPRAVRYEQLTAVLINAIQQQQAEITDLQRQLKAIHHARH